MADDKVVIPVLHMSGVERAVPAVDLNLCIAEAALLPLQGVVEELRHLKVFAAPLEDPPVHLESQILEQGDERVKLLRHPAAEGGGIDHGHPFPFQLAGEIVDLFKHALIDIGDIIGELFLLQTDQIHDRPPLLRFALPAQGKAPPVLTNSLFGYIT